MGLKVLFNLLLSLTMTGSYLFTTTCHLVSESKFCLAQLGDKGSTLSVTLTPQFIVGRHEKNSFLFAIVLLI